MADGDRKLGAEERVRRSVARTLGNAVFAVALLALVGAWAWLGIYQLAPGQAAVILRFGRHVATVGEPGLNWHLPPPIETHEIVNVQEIAREEFGARTAAEALLAPKRSRRRACRRATTTSCSSASSCSTS